MNRAMAVGITGIMLASPLVLAKEKTPMEIPKGAQIGVVSLLDAEISHYHAARESKDNFLKTHPVDWPVDVMLADALQDQLTQLGLTPVPLAMTDSLAHEREDCFVNVALAKGLPKGWSKTCSAPLAQLAASAGVKDLIVLSPGVNNSDHAGSSNRDGLSETLRGWGFFTRDHTSSQDKPALFDETELLLIGIAPDGSTTLMARKWGGTLSVQWQSYVRPTDPKQLTSQQLDELQPLFAAVLDRQVKDLLEQVHVEP